MWPSIVAGKAFSHTVVLTVAVSSGIVVTLIVLIVSHPPVVLVTVSVIEPAALKMWPSIVAGKAFSHTAVLTVAVSRAIVLTLIVLIVSHPPVVHVTVSIIEPASLKMWPSFF